jgi:hypothetical protein
MKLELLEIRKELVVASDFEEDLTNVEKEEMARIKRYYDEEYSKLPETDKKWIDSEFGKWLDIYLSGDCQTGCPSCGCSCPSH